MHGIRMLLATMALAACAATDGTGGSGGGYVVDGDTLAFGTDRERLLGIDAPEARQRCLDPRQRPYPCGRRATEALRALIGDQVVECRGESRDRWGRMLATCFAGGEDLGARMVAAGWAIGYGAHRARYEVLERQARAASRGLRAGFFETPQDWRAAMRAPPGARPPARAANLAAPAPAGSGSRGSDAGG